MTQVRMAWRNLMNRPVQSFITVAVAAAGTALSLLVLMMSAGLKDGIAEASEPYGMLVGTKGSAHQLVMNTIYLMDTPIGNLPFSLYERLIDDPRVAQAVPFALGDQYRGHRIVGTTREFFALNAKPADPPYFGLAQGRIFEGPFEAVIGARTAAQTGLSVGDSFVSGHGIVEADGEHDVHAEHPYRVVGILAQKNVPADAGIFVSIESYWISHGQTPGHALHADHDETEEAAPHRENEAEPLHGEAENEAGVTAVLVKPRTYNDLMRLYQEINGGLEAQAVFPGQVLAKWFDMIGAGEQVLGALGRIVLGMSALTIFLSLYGATRERRKQIAILRAIGAGRRSIFLMVLTESGLLTLTGAALGTALALAAASSFRMWLAANSALAVPLSFAWSHAGMLGAICAIGIAAGLLPALSACRTETARHLGQG